MRRATGFGLAAMLLLLSQLAWAFSYYPAAPQGEVGVSRPTIAQTLVLGPGESIWRAQMTLNGVRVTPRWDERGRVWYTPLSPLPPGQYRVRLTIDVSSGRRDSVYPPLVSDFTFTVGTGAIETPPPPGPEELRALGRLNELRRQAGLHAFTYNDFLGLAALRHARYLAANPAQQSDVHHQRPGTPLFFGRTPSDRTQYFGYDGSPGEVVNFVPKAEVAVDEWLATPYHRIPLIHLGNRELGYGLAADGSTYYNVLKAGPGDSTQGVVVWPYDGQTNVPTGWPGEEVPDPLRLYPGVSGPVGYTITLTFGGTVRRLSLGRAELSGPEGLVSVMRFDPVIDSELKDTVALMPYRPLRSNSTYTVRMEGTVDLGQGPAPFSRQWSFTTGETLEVSKRVVTTLDGVVTRITLEGSGFRSDLRVFLAGLPARRVEVESPVRAVFEPPFGYRGGQADLTVVTGDGRESTWTDFFTGTEEMRFALTTTPLRSLPLIVNDQTFAVPALQHGNGVLLLPESALEESGARQTYISENRRTYWTFGGQVTGDYTLGSAIASVNGRSFALPMPAQVLEGRTYIPAEFFQQAAGARLVQLPGPGQVQLSLPVESISDIAVHWARPQIVRLLRAGIVSGVGDGTFRPDETLTRAAFVKMLTGARSIPPQPGETGGFADLRGHWVAQQGYIGAAVGTGILVPAEYPGGRFEPDRSITREEMAVMVARALGRDLQARLRTISIIGGRVVIGGRTFSDPDLWTRPGYIAEAVEQGIVTGIQESDGTFTFRPGRPATRAEAAVMTVRTLDK